MLKKILYISYDGMTDPLGEGQVINYLIGLTKLGYKFDILSFEKKDKFNKQSERISKILSENNIGWYPKIFHTNPPIISKIYDKIVLDKHAKSLHKKNNYHLIHCRGYLGAEVGLKLKLKKKVPFIFDMRGFWADEKLDGGSWNKKYFFWRKVYQFYKKKEVQFIQNCDHIISLTEAGKKEIETWNFYNTQIPISVIPCCADTDKFSLITDKQKTLSRIENGIELNSFVLSYLGSLGSWYMIEEMLLFFKLLASKIPNSIFLIITNSNHDIILSRLQNFNIKKESVKIITVPFDKVPQNMHATDCSISFIKPVYSKISSSPVKIGEILSMGIPIVANGIGDTKDLIVKNKVGILVNDFSEESFIKIIDNIQTTINTPKEVIRSTALKYYSLEEGIKKYSIVYQSLFP